jgi:integrase
MRRPKPFFRSQTQSWYVQFGRQQINLGPDEKAAYAQYDQMILLRVNEGATGLVPAILDRYWRHITEELAETTTNRRKPILKSFGTYVGNLPLAALKPHHVLDWVNETYPEAGPSYRNTLLTVIKGWSSWATQAGYFPSDPLRAIRKPKPAVRQEFVPHARWGELLEACGPPGAPFRILVEFLLETGARAEEAFKVQTEYVDLAERRVVFPIGSSKGRRRSRIIWLSQRAAEIARDQSQLYPTGHLLRNSRRQPWTKSAVKKQFLPVKEAMGLPWLCATSLRHSFAHHRLSLGQDSLIVSTLLGHTGPRMLQERYGHVGVNSQLMREAADKPQIRG